MSTLRKNVSGQYVYFGMVVAATGAAYGGTAGSITIQVAKDNAASGVGAGTMSSDGSGQFHYAPTQGETNGTSLGFFFTQATCIPVHFAILTTAADPTNATTGGLTNLDAAITSRMATYTQPTGFLAATFPSGTVANTTNITAGTITTVTTVTNQLTAAAIATGVWQDASAGDFTTASSIGKSLYTSGVVPGGTNGLFIAGTNAATTITTGLTTHFIGTVDTVTTYTGNTPQTGDSFARIGAAGVGLTAVGLTGTQTFSNTGTWTGSLTGSVGSVTGSVGSVTGAVGSVTGNVGGNVTGSIGSLSAQAKTDVFTATVTTQLTESYAAVHVVPTLAQAIFEIRSRLTEESVSGTTMTTLKVDGSTTAMTFTLNSATTPTSITRAS